MSSVAFLSSKCTKIVGGWGFVTDPTGEPYNAPQTSPLNLRGLLLRVKKGKREERGCQNDINPRAPEILALPLVTDHIML